MSDNREQWTDAELVARCRAGEKLAWEGLLALYDPAITQCIALSRHRYWWVTREVIEDAAQTVYCQLWRTREHLLAKFRPQRQTLTQHLAQLMCRQVDAALRREQLQRRWHRLAYAEPDERRCGPGLLEERVEQAMPCLSRAEQILVQSALDRTFSDQPQQMSKGALRLHVYRIRLKVEQSASRTTAE